MDYRNYYIEVDGAITGPYDTIGEAEGWAFDLNYREYNVIDNNGEVVN